MSVMGITNPTNYFHASPKCLTIEYDNDDVYTGELDAQGRPHGSGKMQYSDGGSYEGEFKEGKRSGKGKMVFPSGNVYEGDFANDLQNGVGVMQINTIGDRYEGEFRGGRANGHGVRNYANGDQKEGQWKNWELLEPSAQSGNISDSSKQLHSLIKNLFWRLACIE